MTVLFTAGYPWSGKSTFVQALMTNFNDHKVINIDPTSLRPPEYETMPPDDQKQARIAAWEVGQTMLTDATKESNSTLVIFDTCAAKASSMIPHFIDAKVHKHDVVYVFVGAALSECKQRAGIKWPPQDVIKGYGKDFLDSIPKLKDLSSKFFFIKNKNDLIKTGLVLSAQKIAKVILNGQATKPPLKVVTKLKPKQLKPTKVRIK
jgi:predicted kinase